MRANALLPAIAIAACLAGPARAQTAPTPEQALALEGQITAWLRTVVGPGAPLPTRPVQLSAEGDHYLVRVPLGQPGKIQPADAAFTARARMLDGTRWTIDDERLPDDFTITGSESVPDAPDAKNASPDGMHPEPVTYHVTLSGQALHGVFDPTATQPTTNGGTIATVELAKTGGAGASLTQVQQVALQVSTRPIDDAHLDVVQDVTTGSYKVRLTMPDGTPGTVEAQSLHVAAALSGLARDKLVPLARGLGALGRLAKTPGSDSSDGPTPAQRAQMRVLLQMAQAALTGGKLEETAEQISFDVAGAAGTMTRASISLGGDAPQDRLSAQMGLSVDGLVIPALPPAFAAYVPSHFSIRPTLSNLDLAAVTKMGMAATAPAPADGSPPVAGPDVQSLFANGGIDVGFDTLELSAAGAQLTGTGKFNLAGPSQITGQADLTATGLDALITKMQDDPMMAQGVPVLIFLKGIARTSGAQSVWQLTVTNGKVLVNGVDLSAMAGAMGH